MRGTRAAPRLRPRTCSEAIREPAAPVSGGRRHGHPIDYCVAMACTAKLAVMLTLPVHCTRTHGLGAYSTGMP